MAEPTEAEKARIAWALGRDHEWCAKSYGNYANCQTCQRVASLLSERAAEVREEDCRAVCQGCRGRWKAHEPMPHKAMGQWWHRRIGADDSRLCDASPIRSLAPQPPKAEHTAECHVHCDTSMAAHYCSNACTCMRENA